jgi:hypothetical protein
MYTLIIISHFTTGAAQEHVVARNIESQIKCMLIGMQTLSKPLGADDIAFRCDRVIERADKVIE